MRSPTMTICSGIVVLTASLGAPGIALAVDLVAADSAAHVAQPVATSPTNAQPASAIQATSQPRLVSPAEQASGQTLGQALANDALDELRGGESSVDTEVHNHGEVDGNTADGVISGSNVIGDGAFANVNGISTVIQNSGSNVLIQNGTAVNVQFLDPTP